MLQIRMSPGTDLNPGPSESKAGVLPWNSVEVCSTHNGCEMYTTNLAWKPDGKFNLWDLDVDVNTVVKVYWFRKRREYIDYVSALRGVEIPKENKSI